MIQGISNNQWSNVLPSRPLEFVAGLSIFAIAAAGGAVQHVASTSFFILFITSLFFMHKWPAAWRGLTAVERTVLLGLFFYFISAVLSYYNVSDENEYIKHLGKYLRFLLVIPVYLLLSGTGLRLFHYLLAGAVASAPLYLSLALVSIAERPGQPGHGYYHHITFGDLAMANAMFLSAVLLLMKAGKAFKLVLVIAVLSLLYASVLSQARGAWLALPFCLLLLLYFSLRYQMIRLKTVLVVPAVLATAVFFSPAADIISTRWDKAVEEIEGFHHEDMYRTSVGVRLAMWDAAMITWKQHPVIGSGPGDFDLELQSEEVKKLYKNMPLNSSAHNIYFQAIATTGSVGFIALCFALILLPLRLFYMANRSELNIAAICGIVVVTAFAVFGLTESWTLRAPPIAVFLLYLVTLATAASRKPDS